MKSVSFFAFLFFIISITFVSCNHLGSGEFDEIVGLKLSNVDNSGSYPVFSVDSVPRSAYMLDIKFMAKTADSIAIANSYYFKEKIKAIRIFTNTNLDKTHLAGSDVSDLFSKLSANYLFALTKVPAPGTYSFKVLVYKSDEVLESDTQLVHLY